MSRKALNFDDAKIKAKDEARRIINAPEASELKRRGLKLEEQKDLANSALKEFYAEVKEMGVNPKAMKFIIKNAKTPLSAELREEVNDLSVKSGGQIVFQF